MIRALQRRTVIATGLGVMALMCATAVVMYYVTRTGLVFYGGISAAKFAVQFADGTPASYARIVITGSETPFVDWTNTPDPGGPFKLEYFVSGSGMAQERGPSDVYDYKLYGGGEFIVADREGRFEIQLHGWHRIHMFPSKDYLVPVEYEQGRCVKDLYWDYIPELALKRASPGSYTIRYPASTKSLEVMCPSEERREESVAIIIDMLRLDDGDDYHPAPFYGHIILVPVNCAYPKIRVPLPPESSMCPQPRYRNPSPTLTLAFLDVDGNVLYSRKVWYPKGDGEMVRVEMPVDASVVSQSGGGVK